MDLKAIGQNTLTQIKPYAQNIAQFCKTNAPTILAVGGMLGSGATLITSGVAGAKTQKMIAEEEQKLGRKLTTEEVIKLTWKNWIVPVTCCGLSCVCTWKSNRENAARIMAANALANLATNKLNKLEEEVDNLPKEKAKAIKEDIQRDGVREAIMSGGIEYTGKGHTLFKDMALGGYFYSEIRFVHEAFNKATSQIQDGFSNSCTINELFDYMGREPIGCGRMLGCEGTQKFDMDIQHMDGSEEEFGVPVEALYYQFYTLGGTKGKRMVEGGGW